VTSETESTGADSAASADVALVDEPVLQLRNSHAEPLAAELFTMFTRMLADRFTYVIFEVGSDNRYVQVLVNDGTGICAESVGDRYLNEMASLTEAEQAELIRLGWEPPEAGEYAGNWFRCWSPPDLADLVQLVALTLCRVHRLIDPALVTITAHRTSNVPGR
jgi:hypothetical protein